MVLFSVRFHIAHLYEVSNRIKTAKEQYEQLLQEKQLPPLLKADIYRQLGKLFLKNSLNVYIQVLIFRFHFYWIFIEMLLKFEPIYDLT